MESNYVTILWWFSSCFSHRYTRAPHPEPLFCLSPYPLPLGCPRALALGSLLHTSNLPWSSMLYMIIHTFQCYRLKSSHPSLLPQGLFFTSVCLLLPLCRHFHPIYTCYWTINTAFHIYTSKKIFIYCGASTEGEIQLF